MQKFMSTRPLCSGEVIPIVRMMLAKKMVRMTMPRNLCSPTVNLSQMCACIFSD